MLTGYIRINKTKAIRIKKKNQAICTTLGWFSDLTSQLNTTRVQLPEVLLEIFAWLSFVAFAFLLASLFAAHKRKLFVVVCGPKCMKYLVMFLSRV